MMMRSLTLQQQVVQGVLHMLQRSQLYHLEPHLRPVPSNGVPPPDFPQAVLVLFSES